MTREILYNPRLPAPVGYSRAVRAKGGSTIWTSATAPVAGDGSVVGPEDAREQVRTILKNIRDILSDYGGGLDDVVHVTALVVDPADLDTVSETISEVFGAEPPAVSLVGSVTLPSTAFAVEIAVVAQVGS